MFVFVVFFQRTTERKEGKRKRMAEEAKRQGQGWREAGRHKGRRGEKAT